MILKGHGYQSLLEAAPDAMVVVNQSGDIVLVNAQTETQFGYNRDVLLGQPVTRIIPTGFAERLIADDLRSTTEALAQQIGTGIELMGRRHDNSEFPIEIMLSPLKSADGVLVTAAIRNITLRKAAELEVVRAEARYRGLLEAAPDAMVVVNQSGDIVLVNAQTETQFGYNRNVLLGQPVTRIIPTGFAERLIADDLRTTTEALAQQIGTGIELMGRRHDNSEFPIEIMLSPLENADGILVTAAIRNIQERKLAEAKLEASLQEKDILIKEIHHRVKNNLQIVSSLLSLQSNNVVDMNTAEILKESERRIKVMAHLHSTLHQSEDMSSINTRHYLKSVSSETLKFVHTQEINLNHTCDIEEIHFDLSQSMALGQILSELISNCAKHAFKERKAGNIRIRLGYNNDREIEMGVADDGIGFPENFSIQKTKTLGLKLTQGLAQQLHGRLLHKNSNGADIRIIFAEK